MPILVDVRDGSTSGGNLTRGCLFEWVNPTTNPVTLSGCAGFCTQDAYSIGANSQTAAQILANPPGPFGFQDSGWDAPGMPHIVVGGTMREQEVA